MNSTQGHPDIELGLPPGQGECASPAVHDIQEDLVRRLHGHWSHRHTQWQRVTYRAKREVIVSQGGSERPNLLVLSGISPEVLAAYHIEPLVKSAHVGQNLLDHPILSHVYRFKMGTGSTTAFWVAETSTKVPWSNIKKPGLVLWRAPCSN